ncbi:MAG: class I SAM-dependent methyltransferase [Euryarchaeota archaeon]|nr:class I SAM-dependent methyltransferase [Euryarchaeota archaeon]
MPRAEFDRLAPRYERGSRVMSLGRIVSWRRKAVAALSPRRGARYLDVGAGTGELTRAILGAEPRANVVALDASRRMLRAGRLDGLAHVTTRVADATTTGLGSRAFDGIVSGFMLRHLRGFDLFFREMARLLRPGAPLVLLEAHYPEGRFRRLLFQIYFFGFAWLLGALVTGTFRAHVGLYRSVKAFPGLPALEAAAGRHGFVRTGIERGAWTGFFLLVLAAPHPAARPWAPRRGGRVLKEGLLPAPRSSPWGSERRA